MMLNLLRAAVFGLFACVAASLPAKALTNAPECVWWGSYTIINSGSTMQPGDMCTLANGVGYILDFQTDGNLVLYYTPDALSYDPSYNFDTQGQVFIPLWGTNTVGTNPAFAAMTPQGDFGLWGANWNPMIWAVGNWSPGSYLVMYSSGALQVKDVNGNPTWSWSRY